MPRATLHCGGRSPVDGAWDAEKIDDVIGDSGPVREDGVSGYPSGGNLPRELVCLVFRSNPSLFLWLLSDYRIVPRGTSPRRIRQPRPTIRPPATLRAVLIRWRKFFHV